MTKKAILLGTIISLLMLVLVGCGGKPSFTAFLTTHDINSIEVFTGGVPSQAYMKTVSADEDIQRILDGLNALSIVRKAESHDYFAGGIGIIFSFRSSNDHPLVVKNHGNLVYAASGTFVVSGTSLNTDEFWESLNYEAVRVTENDLPVIEITNVSRQDNPKEHETALSDTSDRYSNNLINSEGVSADNGSASAGASIVSASSLK